MELLLVAIAGCTAMDVDAITVKRSEPLRFQVSCSGHSAKSKHGNHVTDIAVDFDVEFPDTEGGRAASDVLEIAIRKSHDRLCTVTRTVSEERSFPAGVVSRCYNRQARLVMSSHPRSTVAPPRQLTCLRPPERFEEFAAAGLRVFHDEYVRPLEPMRRYSSLSAVSFQVDGLISTCGAYSRTLTVPGGTVPAAAVTLVTVQASHRRRGLLTEMMKHQLQDIHERGEEPVALLWASESAIYGRFGYGHASPQVRLAGKIAATASVPMSILLQEPVRSVEVERGDQAIPITSGSIRTWYAACVWVLCIAA